MYGGWACAKSVLAVHWSLSNLRSLTALCKAMHNFFSFSKSLLSRLDLVLYPDVALYVYGSVRLAIGSICTEMSCKAWSCQFNQFGITPSFASAALKSQLGSCQSSCNIAVAEDSFYAALAALCLSPVACQLSR